MFISIVILRIIMLSLLVRNIEIIFTKTPPPNQKPRKGLQGFLKQRKEREFCKIRQQHEKVESISWGDLFNVFKHP